MHNQDRITKLVDVGRKKCWNLVGGALDLLRIIKYVDSRNPRMNPQWERVRLVALQQIAVSMPVTHVSDISGTV